MLALDDYLIGLRWSGRTDNAANHRDLERARLQYLRLLEGAEWAEEFKVGEEEENPTAEGQHDGS
jgi:hypothetical protein